MTENNTSAPPKLYEHCCNVFDAMRRNAVSVRIPDGGATRHALVYEGFITKLFQELRLSPPYFTSVMKRLRKMGCIVQLSRGGGNAPSRWELLEDPDLESFTNAERRRVQGTTRLGAVEQRVSDINNRLLDVESQLEAIRAPE